MALKPSARKKGTGKMDSYTPDGEGAKGSRGPKVAGSSGIETGAHHTGGNHAFQAEVGRRDMPGVPGGSRSLQGE